MFPVAILAGGLATRLGSTADRIPKSLIDINDEPFIIHQLNLLRDQKIGRVIICIGHLGDMISELLGDGRNYGLQIEYSSDSAELLGTAGALKKAIPMRRLGEPEDFPGMVAFFASEDADYITGQVVSISGGLTMHG